MAGGTSQNMDVDAMNLNFTDLMEVDNTIDECCNDCTSQTE